MNDNNRTADYFDRKLSKTELSYLALGFDIKQDIIGDTLVCLLKMTNRCDLSDPVVRQLKSVIYDPEEIDGSCGTVVPSMSLPIDYSIQQLSELRGPVNVQRLIDGTLFRLFFFEGEWRVATNGMIVPNKRWSSSKTFLELFEECRESTPYREDLLSEDCVYFLVAKHPENMMVVQHADKSLVHIGTLKSESAEEYNMRRYYYGTYRDSPEPLRWEEIDADIGLEKPIVSEIQNPCILIDTLNQEQGPVTFTGYLIERYGKKYRVESKAYSEAHAFRGNYPDLTQALIKNWNPTGVQTFTRYFPNQCRAILNIVNEVLTHYQHYRVFKKTDYREKIPSDFMPVINGLHGIYINRRKNDDRSPITESDVLNYVMTC